MSNRKSIIKSSSEYTRVYEKMRGVNFSPVGDDAAKRYGYLENMYVDYAGGGDAVESIPGYRRLYSFGNKINGIYKYSSEEYGTYFLVHAGNSLYRFSKNDIDRLDECGTEKIGTLADAPSKAFSINNSLYILDGESISVVKGVGALTPIGEGDDEPYIPTIYKNGEATEQRNLLTDKFIVEYDIASPYEYTYGTESLIYKIIDEKQKTCAVVGATMLAGGSLHVPSYARIGGEKYTVVKIADRAFESCTEISTLVTNRGLLEIGDSAFAGCTNLSSAVVASTVKAIGSSAFASCTKLLIVYLGSALESIGESVFSDCTALDYLNYSGELEEFKAVEGYDQLSDLIKNCRRSYEKLLLSLPLCAHVSEVLSVKVNGTEHEYSSDGLSGSALVEFENEHAAAGKNIVITSVFGQVAKGGFLDSDFAKSIGGREALLASTLFAVYEGHLFLSGGNRTAGVVFYSAERQGLPNPYYFPVGNYFVDGAANSKVVSLLGSLNSLSVHTACEDGAESIFIHAPKIEDGKTTFPLSETLGGIINHGASLNALGDSLFLSSLGVAALEKSSGKNHFEPKTRCGNIRAKLMCENLTNAQLTEWYGYIVLLVGEHIYLGDTRSQFSGSEGYEYEWYYLSGIGAYENDTRVYRYASAAPEGYTLSESPDDVSEGEIMSVADESGEIIYYVEDGGKKIAVYPTEEFSGGSFYPACAILGGELLVFGTENGDIFAFNSDKRGVAPEYISGAADFDAEDYRAAMGNKIHPDFYDFAGHAPRYALKTKIDDCEVPYLTKSTVRGSLVLKCKNFERGAITCEVGTDKESLRARISFPGEKFGFESLDFSGFSVATREFSTLAVPDGTRGWIEKEISLYSNEFRAPMGVYSISYRYKIKGRIK